MVYAVVRAGGRQEKVEVGTIVVLDRQSAKIGDKIQLPAVLLVDGVFLLGRGLPADLSVHVGLSPAALARRGVPAWQLPAFASYDAEVGPAERCDVLVRAEDPGRPAVRWHPEPPGGQR